MFETFLSFVLPVAKEILWAAAGALLTYSFNTLQTYFFGA
jgi:hypothetical protein